MSRPTVPAPTWLTVPTEDLARWMWRRRQAWPYPLGAARVGQWEASVAELVGEVEAPARDWTRGEERLLADLERLLAEPARVAYLVRAADGIETTYCVLAGADGALAVVDEPGEVRLARVPADSVAVVLGAQLPRLLPVAMTRTTLPRQAADLLASGVARGAAPATMRSALVSAGVAADVADRVLTIAGGVPATGTVGAARVHRGDARIGPVSGGWVEMPDGAMITYDDPTGAVVWEPFTPATLTRFVADAYNRLAGVATFETAGERG